MRINRFWPVLLAGLFAGCAHEERTADYPNPYQRPLNSPGGKFSGLPPAVQNTIRAETGGADIEDIVKDTRSGQVIYKVYFINRDLLPALYIASDGSVLNPDMTVARGAAQDTLGVLSGGATSGLKAGELPQNVMKAIQTRAPRSEIAAIHKKIWGDQEVYIVSFKDPARNPALYLATDGTLLKEKH